MIETTRSARVTARNAEPRAARRRLPSPVAFALQVSMLVTFLAASSAPTPLYSVYQAEWGFSPITVTVVFGVYAIAVLVGLLTVGSLSDHVGRRPVLLAAVGLQIVALVVFATAAGVPALLLARVLQGLSTGAAAGALGAGLLDLDRSRGTVANGVGSIAGTATGALGSALLVAFLPAPTHLVYLTLLVVLVVQGVGVWSMSETSTRKPGALASLRPQLGLPAGARRPLAAAVPALVAVWALAGFYGSLGPTLIRGVAGSSSIVLGGLALAVLAGGGAVTVLLVRDLEPRVVTILGTTALLVGVGVTLLAIASSSEAGFFVGTAIAGVGFGAAFQGALRTVLPLAEPHERAGVLSHDLRRLLPGDGAARGAGRHRRRRRWRCPPHRSRLRPRRHGAGRRRTPRRSAPADAGPRGPASGGRDVRDGGRRRPLRGVLSRSDRASAHVPASPAGHGWQCGHHHVRRLSGSPDSAARTWIRVPHRRHGSSPRPYTHCVAPRRVSPVVTWYMRGWSADARRARAASRTVARTSVAPTRVLGS